MTGRRFPPPWSVEKIPGGFKVRDPNGQSLAYGYSRHKPDDAQIAGGLTEDEARRIASNIAKLHRLSSSKHGSARHYQAAELVNGIDLRFCGQKFDPRGVLIISKLM